MNRLRARHPKSQETEATIVPASRILELLAFRVGCLLAHYGDLSMATAHQIRDLIAHTTTGTA
jgi:hypothetical protein